VRFGDRGLEFYRLHVRRHSFSRKSDVVRDALRSRLHLVGGTLVIRGSAALQESKGFSLVELMVVMGVMGIGSIAMSQMIVNQAKVQAKTTR
jgi:prepilin-type N-terminal cleavage/methylation domain-containing protein